MAQITRNVDSVMFCLSKGLGAPVGSLLVGSREFIRQARIYRKALGGGMRQAGILAAAGLIALEQGPKRLQQDHENAKFIAERLSKTPKIEINPATVQTNILVFDVSRTGMTLDRIQPASGRKERSCQHRYSRDHAACHASRCGPRRLPIRGAGH